MALEDPFKSGSISTEEHTSSGSSEGSSSTPNTPPSPTVLPRTPPTPPPPQALPRIPAESGRYSANAAKKSPRTPKSRLGAIDEDSDAMSPDLPARNPLRRLGLPSMKFTLLQIPTLYATRDKPRNLYDDIEGPRGEKFSDVRGNKRVERQRRCGWRTLVCLGCLLLVIVAAVAIGVIVGLKVKSNHHKTTEDVPPNGTDSGANDGLPVGNYSIASYLQTVNTSCTSTPGTWRCYPDVTYAQSASTSLSTLNWMIQPQNGGKFTITSADRTFSYPFQNVPLTLTGNGTADECWTFTTQWDKIVVPSVSITDDGTTARCFFNDTTLVGRLYTQKPKAQALLNATATTGSSSTNANNKPWPYALDFVETHGNGANVPDCYKYVNGQLGERVSVPVVSTQAGASVCECGYTNFF